MWGCCGAIPLMLSIQYINAGGCCSALLNEFSFSVKKLCRDDVNSSTVPLRWILCSGKACYSVMCRSA